MYKRIFLLLGTNLGDRDGNLGQARQKVIDEAGKITGFSSIYKTAAWGNVDQPDFYNQVIEIETRLDPHQLLEKLLEIEKNMGRVRGEKWGPRMIDLDILFFDQQVINAPFLIVPHPGIPNRKFTLVPLEELTPAFQHPVSGKTVRTLLEECQDQTLVVKLARD
jgi:2-amino-4-hydroxy-6-hydroxymethyldihydropteridine diphosphokinase